MNIEAFYQLIETEDSTNAEIAWQIARGQKSVGDKHFSDFVRAVYAWTFSDLKGYGPVEFLMALHHHKLHCKIFRKKRVPPQSQAIAPLVKAIEIAALETKVFPTGFEAFDQASSLKFETWFLRELGDELAGMPALKLLSFQSRYDFVIKPEFVNCKNIESLHLKSYKSVELPNNLPEMEQLRELSLFLGSRVSDIVWECQQLTHLTLSDVNYDREGTQSHQFWKNAVQLKNLEALTFLHPYSYSTQEIVLPAFIYDIKQLKRLKFFSYSNVHCKFTKQILEIENLEELTLTSIDVEELKILSEHPNLKKLFIEAPSCTEPEDIEKVKRYLPNVETQSIPKTRWKLLS